MRENKEKTGTVWIPTLILGTMALVGIVIWLLA